MDIRTPVRLLAGISGLCVAFSSTAFWFTVAWCCVPILGKRHSFNRFLPSWGRTCHRYGFYKTMVKGMEKMPHPAIWAVNHRHFFDIMVLTAMAKHPVVFVAREGVGRVPVIGTVLRAGGHLFVRRGVGASNARTLQQASKYLDEGISIIFFPEGTRSKDGSVGDFMPGAFHLSARSGKPLVPIALVGTEHAFPSSGLIQPARLAMQVLDPIYPTAAEANSEEYREAVRSRVAEHVEALRPFTGPRIKP